MGDEAVTRPEDQVEREKHWLALAASLRPGAILNTARANAGITYEQAVCFCETVAEQVAAMQGEGMVLVPRVATEEMLDVGEMALCNAGVDNVERGDAEAAYSAMIAAAEGRGG